MISSPPSTSPNTVRQVTLLVCLLTVPWLYYYHPRAAHVVARQSRRLARWNRQVTWLWCGSASDQVAPWLWLVEVSTVFWVVVLCVEEIVVMILPLVMHCLLKLFPRPKKLCFCSDCITELEKTVVVVCCHCGARNVQPRSIEELPDDLDKIVHTKQTFLDLESKELSLDLVKLNDNVVHSESSVTASINLDITYKSSSSKQYVKLDKTSLDMDTSKHLAQEVSVSERSVNSSVVCKVDAKTEAENCTARSVSKTECHCTGTSDTSMDLGTTIRTDENKAVSKHLGSNSKSIADLCAVLSNDWASKDLGGSGDIFTDCNDKSEAVGNNDGTRNSSVNLCEMLNSSCDTFKTCDLSTRINASNISNSCYIPNTSLYPGTTSKALINTAQIYAFSTVSGTVRNSSKRRSTVENSYCSKDPGNTNHSLDLDNSLNSTISKYETAFVATNYSTKDIGKISKSTVNSVTSNDYFTGLDNRSNSTVSKDETTFVATNSSIRDVGKVPKSAVNGVTSHNHSIDLDKKSNSTINSAKTSQTSMDSGMLSSSTISTDRATDNTQASKLSDSESNRSKLSDSQSRSSNTLFPRNIGPRCKSTSVVPRTIYTSSSRSGRVREKCGKTSKHQDNIDRFKIGLRPSILYSKYIDKV